MIKGKVYETAMMHYHSNTRETEKTFPQVGYSVWLEEVSLLTYEQHNEDTLAHKV